MKANQMPPVENLFVGRGCKNLLGADAKKAPSNGAFSGMDLKVLQGAFVTSAA
jgi:hypothetical protein